MVCQLGMQQQQPHPAVRHGFDLEGRAMLHASERKARKLAVDDSKSEAHHDFTKGPSTQDLVNLILFLLLKRRRLWQQRLGERKGLHVAKWSAKARRWYKMGLNPIIVRDCRN